MTAASSLHFSFLQAVNAVMLWPVHVQKVPQASERLCPAKLKLNNDKEKRNTDSDDEYRGARGATPN